MAARSVSFKFRIVTCRTWCASETAAVASVSFRIGDWSFAHLGRLESILRFLHPRRVFFLRFKCFPRTTEIRIRGSTTSFQKPRKKFRSKLRICHCRDWVQTKPPHLQRSRFQLNLSLRKLGICLWHTWGAWKLLYGALWGFSDMAFLGHFQS